MHSLVLLFVSRLHGIVEIAFCSEGGRTVGPPQLEFFPRVIYVLVTHSTSNTGFVQGGSVLEKFVEDRFLPKTHRY